MGEGTIDRVELARLYELYGALVFRVAHRILGSDAARDVCQDVFVEILRARPVWNPASPVGWLYVTTTNKCLNVLRATQRWARVTRAQLPAASVGAEPPIGAMLKDLPERLQEIALYYGLGEMSQDEIASILGISQKTVSNRIQEIRTWLGEPDRCCRSEAR